MSQPYRRVTDSVLMKFELERIGKKISTFLNNLNLKVAVFFYLINVLGDYKLRFSSHS
jgi:hypothetical protein